MLTKSFDVFLSVIDVLLSAYKQVYWSSSQFYMFRSIQEIKQAGYTLTILPPIYVG